MYHGTVYFLIQNEALNANSYFNKLTINSTTGKVTPRARVRFFQMGRSLGGPVWISHVYDGHNKTFLFVNYDYTITNTPTVLNLTVPTAAQRSGNLSNALAPTDANGKARSTQKIFQPARPRRRSTTIRSVPSTQPLRRFSPSFRCRTPREPTTPPITATPTIGRRSSRR